jgi:hypothetical protein
VLSLSARLQFIIHRNRFRAGAHRVRAIIARPSSHQRSLSTSACGQTDSTDHRCTGDGMIKGSVLKRARGEDGNPIGRRHTNPMLDSREYELQFQDGPTAEYSANVFAENISSQCDFEGRQFQLLVEISDHKKNASAMSKDDGCTMSHNGNKVSKMTTRGWKFNVEWKDGTSSWVLLKEIKASNPIELAEYANGIAKEPAMAWWVKDVLKKRNRIISKMKSRYWKTTHNFGYKIPHSVEGALAIDQRTNTDLWRKAIEKEMKAVGIAFERWREGTLDEARSGKKLVGFQEIKCHMIFDIKMDFTRKARFVAGGHTTDVLAEITYSSVV